MKLLLCSFAASAAAIAMHAPSINYYEYGQYMQTNGKYKVRKWENQLPTLIIHGLGDPCSTTKVWMLQDMIDYAGR